VRFLAAHQAAPVDPTTQWVQAGRKVDFAITQTKSMIQKARGASYLPDLHMRLAELYTERARYAWLVVYERRRARGDDSRALEAPEARLLKNLAIGVYSAWCASFRRYARADEATFLMAHEFRELGEFDSMKETYEKLIESYPKSRYRARPTWRSAITPLTRTTSPRPSATTT
jgi:tetratricopeptide (TPR) repeat protein